MEFGFTSEQEMIRSQAVEFLKREWPSTRVRKVMDSVHGDDAELWAKMADLGWMSLVLDEAYGGAGLSFIELVVILEEMGRALVPGEFFSTVVLGGLTVAEGASAAQKKEWLPRLALGQLKLTLALAENDFVEGPADINLKAEKHGSVYLLTGSKLYVPDAHAADLILCAARTAKKSDGAAGITLFAVDRRTAGVTVTPLKTMDATRRLYEVTLEKVEVPADRVLGEVDQAWPLLEKVLAKASIGLAAEMAGGSRQALEMTVDYARVRTQFGKPIGSFQAIQHRCADMMLLTESARSGVYAAACAVSDNSSEMPLLAAIAKAYASDAYSWVTGEAIQIHGGMGYTWEHDAHLYFKRAKADEVTFGDATFHRARVARMIGLTSKEDRRGS